MPLEHYVQPFTDFQKLGMDLFEGKQFLNSLIKQLNDCHGTDFTLDSAIELVEQRIYALGLSEDCVACLNLFLFTLKQENILNQRIYPKSVANNGRSEKGFPATMIVGGVEVFAGALLSIIPFTRPVGVILISDGARRMFDGVEKMDEANTGHIPIKYEAVSKALVGPKKKTTNQTKIKFTFRSLQN